MKNMLLPLKFLGIMWAVFILNSITPFELNQYGLLPRTQSGLLGIFTAPFLHGDLGHIMSNSVPLLVLLTVTAVFYNKRIYSIIFFTVVLGGVLEWMFARTAYHVGASGLIYGLVGFLTFSGLFQKKLIPFLVAIPIGLIYGTTMWMGMLPTQCSSISWEGHLFGAIGGILTAKLLSEKKETVSE